MKNQMEKSVMLNEKLVNWRLIDQEIIFLHNKENTFYELNKTATYIWLNANGKKTIGDIIKGLPAKFIVDKQTAEKDAIEFIGQALKNKIFVFA
jgi:hypothetical protein